MFKNLIFKIKYYRTIKEIIRICNKYSYKIGEKNKKDKLFSKFSKEGFSGDVEFVLDYLKFYIFSASLSVHFFHPTQTTSLRLGFLHAASFGSVFEFTYPQYIRVIGSYLSQAISILRIYEKQILEEMAKEEKEKLDDINKILLKR